MIRITFSLPNRALWDPFLPRPVYFSRDPIILQSLGQKRITFQRKAHLLSSSGSVCTSCHSTDTDQLLNWDLDGPMKTLIGPSGLNPNSVKRARLHRNTLAFIVKQPHNLNQFLAPAAHLCYFSSLWTNKEELTCNSLVESAFSHVKIRMLCFKVTI